MGILPLLFKPKQSTGNNLTGTGKQKEQKCHSSTHVCISHA